MQNGQSTVALCGIEILINKGDLCYEEDSHAQVDSNVVMTKSGKIIEFQTTAEGEPYEQSQLIEIFNIAKSGIEQIINMYE